MTLEQIIEKEEYKADLCSKLVDKEREQNNYEKAIEFGCKVNYHRELVKQLKELSIVKHKYSKILKTINKLEGGREWLL